MQRDHVIIVSSAYWNEFAATNKQWMAKEYMKRGYACHYIEPFVSRLPRINIADLTKVIRIFSQYWPRTNKPTTNTPELYRVPYIVGSMAIMRCKLIKNLELYIQRKSLARMQRRLANCDSLTVIYYHPFIRQLDKVIETKNINRVHNVYHAVDDLDSLPWNQNRSVSLISLIKSNLPDCDMVLCTNPVTASKVRLQGINSRIYIEPNRISLSQRTVKHLNYKKRELGIVCVATFTSLKVDYDFLTKLIAADSHLELNLIGPLDGSCERVKDFESLCNHPRVHWHGALEYHEMCLEIRKYKVGLICPPISNYTLASTPMKFLDYVLQGAFVVTREMPYTALYKSLEFKSCGSPEGMAKCIKRILNSEDYAEYAVNANIDKLHGFTYEKRVDEINALLRGTENYKPSSITEYSYDKYSC